MTAIHKIHFTISEGTATALSNSTGRNTQRIHFEDIGKNERICDLAISRLEQEGKCTDVDSLGCFTSRYWVVMEIGEGEKVLLNRNSAIKRLAMLNISKDAVERAFDSHDMEDIRALIVQGHTNLKQQVEEDFRVHAQQYTQNQLSELHIINTLDDFVEQICQALFSNFDQQFTVENYVEHHLQNTLQQRRDALLHGLQDALPIYLQQWRSQQAASSSSSNNLKEESTSELDEVNSSSDDFDQEPTSNHTSSSDSEVAPTDQVTSFTPELISRDLKLSLARLRAFVTSDEVPGANVRLKQSLADVFEGKTSIKAQTTIRAVAKLYIAAQQGFVLTKNSSSYAKETFEQLLAILICNNHSAFANPASPGQVVKMIYILESIIRITTLASASTTIKMSTLHRLNKACKNYVDSVAGLMKITLPQVEILPVISAEDVEQMINPVTLAAVRASNTKECLEAWHNRGTRSAGNLPSFK